MDISFTDMYLIHINIEKTNNLNYLIFRLKDNILIFKYVFRFKPFKLFFDKGIVCGINLKKEERLKLEPFRRRVM